MWGVVERKMLTWEGLWGVELLNAVLSEGEMPGVSPVLEKRETGGEASWLATSP